MSFSFSWLLLFLAHILSLRHSLRWSRSLISGFAFDAENEMRKIKLYREECLKKCRNYSYPRSQKFLQMNFSIAEIAFACSRLLKSSKYQSLFISNISLFNNIQNFESHWYSDYTHVWNFERVKIFFTVTVFEYLIKYLSWFGTRGNFRLNSFESNTHNFSFAKFEIIGIDSQTPQWSTSIPPSCS